MSQGSDDAFEEAVAETLDRVLTPTQRMSRVSSGLSSTKSNPDDPQITIDQPTSTASLKCSFCDKPPYKHEKAFLKHIFLHKVEDYNKRKPTVELTSSVLHDIVVSTLQKMKDEPNSPPEKLTVITEVLHASDTSSDWVWFLEALLETIVEKLAQRTKLLPTAQYEEFQCFFNKFLNNKDSYTKLKETFEVLISGASLKHTECIGLVLARLCSQIPDEVMIFITSEMSVKSRRKENPPSSIFNEGQFIARVSSVIRLYFAKATQLGSEVWQVRSSCIRDTFIYYKDDIYSRSSEIVKKSNWLDKNLVPSESFVTFCKAVENIIEDQLASKKSLELDDIVLLLLEAEHSFVTRAWESLTECHLEDEDSIVFMRDFVSVLLKGSLKLQEECVRGQVEERQRLQKFGIRDNLKRN